MLGKDAIKRPVITAGPEAAPYGARWGIKEHPLPCDAKVHEAMARPALPADSLDPAMREEKIGCLPVLEGQEPVGIMTGIVLTGTTRPGALPLPDRPGEFTRRTAFFAEKKTNIHPVVDGRAMNVLRVETLETRPPAGELRTRSFELIRPPEKP